MLTLKIFDTAGKVLFEKKGMNIDTCYSGLLEAGYKIRVSLDSCEFISVKLDPKKFTPRLTDLVRQVFEEGNQSIPMIMAKTVLNRFFALYRDVKNPGKHIDSYADKFALKDKKIKYIENGKKRTVKVLDVNRDSLALIVETKDGRKINVTSQSSVIIPNRI